MKKNLLTASLILGFAFLVNTGCAGSKNNGLSKLKSLEKLENLEKLESLSSLADDIDIDDLSEISNSGKDKGNGETTKKTFDLKGFNKLSVSGIASIHFTQGNSYKIKAEGSPRLVDNIKIHVKDNTLKIEYKDNQRINGNNEHLNIYIEAPNLDSFEMSGACVFTAESIKSKDFNCEISGAVQCYIGKLQSTEAKFDLSGAAKVKMDVEADRLSVDNSGAVKTLLAFKGKRLDIDNSGASKMDINVNCEELYSDNSGASKIIYTGTADKTHIENSGMAKTSTRDLNNL